MHTFRIKPDSAASSAMPLLEEASTVADLLDWTFTGCQTIRHVSIEKSIARNDASSRAGQACNRAIVFLRLPFFCVLMGTSVEK